ncbi:MAG: hypothetical protein AMXMBFR46_00900 [Acidimicrobiia bacterium]
MGRDGVARAAGSEPEEPDARATREPVPARLVVDHPDVPAPRIADLLDHARTRTSDARIETFRWVLAERTVRAQLRSRVTPDAVDAPERGGHPRARAREPRDPPVR